MDPGDRAARFRFLLRDRDRTATAAPDQVLAGTGAPVITTPARSPQADSFAERYTGTLRRQCPDRLLIVGDSGGFWPSTPGTATRIGPASRGNNHPPTARARPADR